MKKMFLDADFDKDIVQKKDLLDDLKLAGIDLKLIRRAYHHMTSPPYECHEVFFKKPKIEEIKESNPTEYEEAMGACKRLSSLLDNDAINEDEKEMLKSLYDRIVRDYEIDLLDRKALLDSFRSQTDVESIEEYKDYSDSSFGCAIDANLKTELQCEEKLITMLYDYMMPLAQKVNDEKPIGHEKDYKQKDVFELIAEILNLCWPHDYSYEKIRTRYKNYKTVKR
jgi:hypothetical protein